MPREVRKRYSADAVRRDALVDAAESCTLVSFERRVASALGLGAPYSVCVLDVGGDGLLDLVVGEDNPGNDRVLEYPRTALGFQTPTVLLEPLQKPVVESTGDMDGNGFEDLAIAQFEGSSVVLLAGDAAGLTLGYALDFGGETTSVLFEDLDGDGLAEVMAGFNNAERVKKVKILSSEWLPDSEELTPTSKLKRRGVHARYQDEIEALYA